jgi:erythrin-vacuolar iron transport family protein
MTVESTSLADDRHKTFLLQEIQPGLLGLMDGSVSTLAPIFATAGLTGRPLSAIFVELAASLGAAISMGLSRRRCPTTEALPDAAARCDVVQ